MKSLELKHNEERHKENKREKEKEMQILPSFNEFFQGSSD
jgi:hypothetical protein